MKDQDLYKDSTDSELIKAILQDKRGAEDELVERYQARIQNFIRKSIYDDERSEDLTQEVFMRVFKNAWKFDHSRKFSTWIFTIASNIAKNEYRSRNRKYKVINSNEIKEDWMSNKKFDIYGFSVAPPDVLYDRKVIREEVEESINHISKEHREIILLRIMDELTYEEIEKILNIPVGTVKSRIHRAKESLQKLLVDYQSSYK